MPSYKVKPASRDGTLPCSPGRFALGAERPTDTTNFQLLRKAWESTRLIASATAAAASSAAISTAATTVPVTSTASAMFRLRTGFVYVKRATANF